MHETVLGAGVESHPPHKHEHEEIMIVVEGTLETYLDGKTEAAQAGSVIYFGPNQMHGVRNIGTTPCGYYVVELRGNEA
jgi:XRE family transcriptional regulator, regulator of sulfur utilization